MPLPIILGIGAAIAGGAGLIGGVNGAVKMKEAPWREQKEDMKGM